MNFESIAKILKDIQFTFREDSKDQKIFNVMKLIFEIFTFLFLMKKKNIPRSMVSQWTEQLIRRY